MMLDKIYVITMSEYTFNRGTGIPYYELIVSFFLVAMYEFI